MLGTGMGSPGSLIAAPVTWDICSLAEEFAQVRFPGKSRACSRLTVRQWWLQQVVHVVAMLCGTATMCTGLLAAHAQVVHDHKLLPVPCKRRMLSV